MSKMISAVLLALALALSIAQPGTAQAAEKNKLVDWKNFGKWKHLSRFIATDFVDEVLSDPEVEAELKALTGEHYLRVRTFRTIAPITTGDTTALLLRGTGEYKLVIESKYIWIDWSNGEIQVLITTPETVYLFSRKREYREIPYLFKTEYYGREVHEIIKVPPTRPDFLWIK